MCIPRALLAEGENMSIRIPASILFALLVTGFLFPSVSNAYHFVPSDLEWAAWPQYCKARYVTTGIGETQKWSGDLSRAEIETQRNLIGDPSFIHVHHYCAGLAWMMRARLEGNAERRALMLKSANSEVSYTFTRIPPSSPIYATVAVNLAQIRRDQGNPKDGIQYIEKAIEASPNDYRGYLGLALLYRDVKDLAQARDALLRGDAAVGGQSNELQYTLGLIYIELGDFDNAVECAKKVYENGYPLPGLQDKLKRAGRWPAD